METPRRATRMKKVSISSERAQRDIAHLLSPCQPRNLDLSNLREPPAPNVLGALGNFLPSLDKVLERDAPAFLLQIKRLLTPRSNANNHSYESQPTGRRKEEIGILRPAHAHQGSVGEREDEVEEVDAGGEVAKCDSGSVRGGTEAAGESLVGDGT